MKLIQYFCVALFINLNTCALAANDSTTTPLIPSTVARDQSLLVDSQSPNPYTPQTYGSSQMITCDNNEQLVGIIEENKGAGSEPGEMAYARTTQTEDNYIYVPRCRNPSHWTGSCTRDWVKEYNKIDTMKIVCAKNSLRWENLNEYPDPDTSTSVIGSYVAPAPAP